MPGLFRLRKFLVSPAKVAELACLKTALVSPQLVVVACLLLFSSSLPAFARPSRLPVAGLFEQPVESTSESVNRLLMNGGSLLSPPTVSRMAIGNWDVWLVTPISSELNQPGDPVAAVVAGVRGLDGTLAAALPPMTLLEGFVEGVQRPGRCREDGFVTVRFYWARRGAVRVPVDLIVDSADAAIHPGPVKASGRKRLRTFLTVSARLAIPAALGSGGTSLAISTGAGALIGALLAEDRRFVRGALRGAWEGAGLSFLDPIVLKGRPVNLHSGSRIILRVGEPFVLPGWWTEPPGSAQRSGAAQAIASPEGTPLDPRSIAIRPGPACNQLAAPAVVLNTSVSLLRRGDSDKDETGEQAAAQAVVDQIKDILAQGNLAKALALVDEAQRSHPFQRRLADLHRVLFQYVTGERSDYNDLR